MGSRGRGGVRAEAQRQATAALRRRPDERGQALLLALGGAFVLLAGALALVAIAGAVTGKGRVQRAADLAAISAARSMRDDLPRLLSTPTLPNGLPNLRHIEKAVYLSRARDAAFGAAKANGVSAAQLRVSFPDRTSFVRLPSPKPPRRPPPPGPRRCPRWRAAAATAGRWSIATERA